MSARVTSTYLSTRCLGFRVTNCDGRESDLAVALVHQGLRATDYAASADRPRCVEVSFDHASLQAHGLWCEAGPYDAAYDGGAVQAHLERLVATILTPAALVAA